jgi:uncharacterized protein
LRRVAALAGILPAEEGARPPLPVFEDAVDVRSERHGLWFPEVAVGTSVAEGSRLGRVEDAFGDVVHEVLAPVTGVLVFGLSSLAAAEGDLLAAMAQPAPGR